MIVNRPKQNNCQKEPPYPDHETITMTIRDPDVYMDNDCEVKRFDDPNYNPNPAPINNR